MIRGTMNHAAARTIACKAMKRSSPMLRFFLACHSLTASRMLIDDSFDYQAGVYGERFV